MTRDFEIAQLPATPRESSPIMASPPLVDGEDLGLYGQYAARVRSAVKPRDFVEELLAQDVIDLSWDLRRMRIYKAAALSAWSWRGVEELATVERSEAEAKELARDWAASYDEDMAEVKTMLDQRGLPYETLAALAWAERIDLMTQIDSLIASAERRRNDALREIERRRAAFAAALREATADVVDATFEEVPPEVSQVAP